jgi:hypothetical protein
MGALIITLTSLAFLFLGLLLYSVYLTYDPHDFIARRTLDQHSASLSPDEQTRTGVHGTS